MVRIICYILMLIVSIYKIDLLTLLLMITAIELIIKRKKINKLFRIIIGRNLFEGNDLMFKKNISDVSIYGEYGVGESTIWAYNNTKAKILAVDTSKEWIDHVKSKIDSSNRVLVEWVDLGELGKWGRPISYKKRKFIQSYLKSVWSNTEKPELVLIDGRFRVACFLFSLINGVPGTKIIFDDYTNRPYYHVVEEFVKPVDTYGRQALFIVPSSLNIEKIKKTADNFIHVMD